MIFGRNCEELAPDIPVIDIRDGGPPHHAQLSAAKARALRDACLVFSRAALPLVPVLDRAARRWLHAIAVRPTLPKWRRSPTR